MTVLDLLKPAYAKKDDVRENGEQHDETARTTPPGSDEEQRRSGDDLAATDQTKIDTIPEEQEEPSSWKERIQKFRKINGTIVNDQRVQTLIVLLIAANAIMLGIQTFDFVTDDPKVERNFEIVDEVFLVIFTIELAMQFIFNGLRLFFDWWLVFDLAIIAMSWAFQEVQIIRAFRIFRALRLITRIKVMKNLVTALFGVLPRMAAIIFLLCMIFYIFGVMMTQLFGDLYPDGDTEVNYFTRLDNSFFTLFQIMTLDNWADVCREVQQTYSWAWLPFIAFVIISGFIVVNLIIAVICDAISALHADEKAKIHGMYHEGYSEHDLKVVEEIDVMEQLQMLEDQVDELTRMQDQTLERLEFLTHYLSRLPPKKRKSLWGS